MTTQTLTIPARMPGRSEASLSAAVREYLATRRDVLITCVDAADGKGRGKTEPGTGDWCGVLAGGLHIEIELKSAKGRAREKQLQRQRRVRALGGVYEFCRSVADVHRVIEAAKRAAEGTVRA